MLVRSASIVNEYSNTNSSSLIPSPSASRNAINPSLPISVEAINSGLFTVRSFGKLLSSTEMSPS